MKEEFCRIAAVALSHQQPDGLWRVFVDDPSVSADTSSLRTAAGKSVGPNARNINRLAATITSDGLLGGVSQANKNGEALQRSEYRIISQMGMGLMTQLIAAVSAERTQ